MASRVRADDKTATGQDAGHGPDEAGELRLRLQQAESALDARDEALRGKQADIERLERLTHELRSRLEQTEQALRERGSELQRLSGELETRSDALRAEAERWRDAARRVADEVGAKARAQAQEAGRRLDQLGAAKAELEEELRRLEQKRLLALDELSRNREALRRARKDFELLIGERDARIVELEGANLQLAEDRAAAKARAVELKSERETLRAGIAAEKAARAAAVGRIDELQAELDALRQARDRLVNSPSWRLTRPLRRLAALGRRIAGHKGGS